MRVTRFWLGCIAVIAPMAGCSDEEKPPAPVVPEVEIVRGGAGNIWFDVTVIGEGFAGAERVEVQIGRPDRPERLGRGVAAIVDGAFSIHFPAVLEGGLYKDKRVWIDADGDGRCGGDDAVFLDQSAHGGPMTMRVPDPFQRVTCAELVDDWPDE